MLATRGVTGVKCSLTVVSASKELLGSFVSYRPPEEDEVLFG